MCDQAWTVAMRWRTELEEIAFSQEMGICAEVKFTFPSTTHPPPFKAPYSLYKKLVDGVEYFFLFRTGA